MMYPPGELRGWKSICRFLDVMKSDTAKRRLTRLGVRLLYDGRTPLISTAEYYERFKQHHKGPVKKPKLFGRK